MDIARGFAVLLVIFVHGGSVYNEAGYQLPMWLEISGILMAPYRMPLLIFLSGFLLTRSLDKGVFAFGYGKIRNIAWPYVIWTIIFCVVSRNPEYLLARPVWTGGTYLWYMFFLMVFYGVAMLFARMPLLVMACFAFLIAIIMPDGSKYGERLFVLMGYFFCGAFAGKNLQYTNAFISNRKTIFLVPMIFAISIYSVYFSRITYAPSFAIIIIPAIIGICSALYHLSNHMNLQFVKFIGRNSIVYYVTHLPIYVTMIEIFRNLYISNPYIIVFSNIIVAIVIATLLAISHQHRGWGSSLFSAPDLLRKDSPAVRKFVAAVDRLPFLPRAAK